MCHSQKNYAFSNKSPTPQRQISPDFFKWKCWEFADFITRKYFPKIRLVLNGGILFRVSRHLLSGLYLSAKRKIITIRNTICNDMKVDDWRSAEYRYLPLQQSHANGQTTTPPFSPTIVGTHSKRHVRKGTTLCNTQKKRQTAKTWGNELHRSGDLVSKATITLSTRLVGFKYHYFFRLPGPRSPLITSGLPPLSPRWGFPLLPCSGGLDFLRKHIRISHVFTFSPTVEVFRGKPSSVLFCPQFLHLGLRQ